MSCIVDGTDCDLCLASIQARIDAVCDSGGQLVLKECSTLPGVPEDCPCLQHPSTPDTIEALIADAEAVAADVQNFPAFCTDEPLSASYGRSDNFGGFGSSGWVASSGRVVSFSCLLHKNVDFTSGDGFVVNLLGLSPNEEAGCREMVRALQTADPFGVCSP
jgi:hypothetical protein